MNPMMSYRGMNCHVRGKLVGKTGPVVEWVDENNNSYFQNMSIEQYTFYLMR